MEQQTMLAEKPKEAEPKTEELIEIVTVKPSPEETVKLKESEILEIRNESHDGERWGYFIETDWRRYFIDRETAELVAEITGKEIQTHVFQTQRLDDEETHKQHHEWIETCKANQQNFSYMMFDATIEIDVNTGETKAQPNVSTAVERPFKPEDDSYGGMWGSGGYGDKEGEELKQQILGTKKRHLQTPYKEGLHKCDFMRDIKAENIRLFITPAGQEYLKMKGVNAEELQKEFNSMPENHATKDDELKQELFEMVQQEKERTNNEFSRIDNSMRARLKMESRYGCEELTCAEEHRDMPIEKLVELRDNIQTKLETLEQIEEDFYHEIRGEKPFDMGEENVKVIMELLEK